METRVIVQIKIYVLCMNTFGRAEESRVAAISTEYDSLVGFYNSQLLPEPERDEEGYLHAFKEGPLHRLNPVYSLELNHTDYWGNGISDDWIDENQLPKLKQTYLFLS